MMLAKNQKLEIDEAAEALERHNEGMQNKMNESSLGFVPASFGQRADPTVNVKGKIARCNCISTDFLVFQLDHQDHLHLQCSHCGTSYCPVGKCKL